MKGIPEDEEYHRDIQGNEIFTYPINHDTIDNVLSELMTNGQKVHSGEDVGKTIIFAYNHKHAERIVERFRHLYPERGADYCQLIDNQGEEPLCPHRRLRGRKQDAADSRIGGHARHGNRCARDSEPCILQDHKVEDKI